MKEFGSFKEAAGAYLDQADWLTDKEAPMVQSFMMSAIALDTKVQSALLAQHRMAWEALEKARPVEVKTGDDLDDDLEDD